MRVICFAEELQRYMPLRRQRPSQARIGHSKIAYKGFETLLRFARECNSYKETHSTTLLAGSVPRKTAASQHDSERRLPRLSRWSNRLLLDFHDAGSGRQAIPAKNHAESPR